MGRTSQLKPSTRAAIHVVSPKMAAVLALVVLGGALSGVLGGCSGPTSARDSAVATTTTDSEPSVPRTSEPTVPPPPTAANPGPTVTRPPWLGQRPLATDARGFGIAEPTPPELVDRQLPTIDTIPPPLSQDTFASTIAPLAGDALNRSTWREGCPVGPEALRHVTVSFWGFDGLAHTGELIVAEEWATDIVGVFEVAWNERFPFEEMRIVTPADLEAEPTGDGNNTASFVCRAATGGTRFSEHAYGLAIDINPFHNPYLRGELLLPELAGSYLERADLRHGMLTADSAVVVAFKDIGWSWGGEWASLKDWQHFSQNGL